MCRSRKRRGMRKKVRKWGRREEKAVDEGDKQKHKGEEEEEEAR